MALDNATKRIASCLIEEARTTTATTITTTSSELSSESDGSEFFSDSDACRALVDIENADDADTDAEYKYSPLNCDSDMDNEVEHSSDESIALLAHEILCCEHDTDTETDSNEDDDDDEDEDEDDDLETEHNYALLMCSEDDDELDLGQHKLKQQEQKLLQLKQQGAALRVEHSPSAAHELQSMRKSKD